jgi:hypothetical protein
MVNKIAVTGQALKTVTGRPVTGAAREALRVKLIAAKAAVTAPAPSGKPKGGKKKS